MIAALQCGLLMAPIAPESIYTKTAKGILEVGNKSARLPRELGLVFLSIDGKSSIGELLPRSGMTAPQFHHAVGTLVSDGYIKTVSTASSEKAPAREDEVDFIPKQAVIALNMEAASHALAAADAAKRAQAEARAALDARMRVEAEARARALAESRADAESQAQVAAEEAARDAINERVQAELQARDAADAQGRAQAETRVRAAAAAAVRAEAEARVRASAFARAKADAETRRIAQEEALKEAEARARSEEQAQARAAAEARAGVALEAQMQALLSVRARAEGPQAEDAEAARARVRELEQVAAEARAAARESAEAEGRADEVAEPEMDIADRVRQLNARVSAERRAREEASRRSHMLADGRVSTALHEGERAWPWLQLADTAPPAAVNLLDIPIEPRQDAGRVPEAAPRAPEDAEFPVVDLDRAEPPPRTSEHEPTALERAMARIARAKAETRLTAPPIEAAPGAPAPERPAQPSPETAPAITADAAPPEKLVPTLADDEPLQERLNIDRAAHDIMAEEAEARRKAETAQFTRDAIDARRRRADEEARKAQLARSREQRRKALTASGIALVVVPVAGVLWLQFSRLDGYIPEAERALEKRFYQPVSIAGLRYPLLPRPRLILEKVSIGQDSLQAERVEAPVLPLALLAGASSFATVEVDGAEIDQRALGMLPVWTGGRIAGSIQTERLRVRELKVKLSNATLEPMNGEVEFAPNGTVRRASFANEKVKILLTPQADGARLELTATGWRVPYGPPLEWSHFQLRGLIDETRVATAEFTGRVAGGAVEGALNARWGNAIEIRGEFSAAGVRLRELARVLGSEFSATGMLKATGRFETQAPDWSGLTAGSRLEAAFTGSRGELINIDLMRAVQSPTPGAMRGGRTPFEAFSGTLQMTGGRYVLPQLTLQASPLSASGTMTVSAAGELDGRITAVLAARGTRSTLLLGGTLKDPQLRR
jgi:hypothetical protein